MNDNSGKKDKNHTWRVAHASILRTVLPLLFFTSFFVVNGLLGWFVIRNIADNQNAENDSLETIYLLNEVYKDILRAESGQRGFMLTGQESYLEPFHDAMGVLTERTIEIEEALMDEAHEESFRVLLGLINEKIRQINSMIVAIEAGRIDDATGLLFSNRGLDLMNEITALKQSMESYERGLLQERSIQSRRSQNSALVLILLSNVVGLVMVCLTYALIRNNHVKEKSRADFENRAKTEFLANLSHEIRTPLTAIIGYTELLQSKYSDTGDDELNERLSVISRNSVHLLSLLNDTLDLSKIEAEKMEMEFTPVRLDWFLADIVSIVSANAQDKGLKFRFEQVSDLPETIISDATRLRQIILNLTNNAIKFTKKGYVALEVGLTVKAEDDGELRQLLSFAVIDTGIGIKKGEADNIFRPFVQTNTREERRLGTGLGLTISRRLASLLGGDLTVSSKFRRGSVFTLLIDPGDISEQTLQQLELKSQSGTTQLPDMSDFNGRILLADDIEDIRNLVTSILDRAGIACDVVSNGKRALELLLEDNNDTYSLVLLDINMPVMTGDRVVEELRKRKIEVPAIALTAASMQGDRERLLACGFNGYVGKPISARNLLTEIRSVQFNSSSGDEYRVLVIEDQKDARTALCDMLDLLGTPALGVATGEEAKAAVSSHDFSLILTDLNLDQEDGTEVARELKQLNPLLHVVLITGDSQLRAGPLPEDIDRLLIKPVSVDNLRQISNELS